jgi:hypothetical protein
VARLSQMQDLKLEFGEGSSTSRLSREYFKKVDENS